VIGGGVGLVTGGGVGLVTGEGVGRSTGAGATGTGDVTGRARHDWGEGCAGGGVGDRTMSAVERRGYGW